MIAVSTTGHVVTRTGFDLTGGRGIGPIEPDIAAVAELAPQGRLTRPLVALESSTPDTVNPAISVVTTMDAQQPRQVSAQSSIFGGPTEVASPTSLWPMATGPMHANANSYWYGPPAIQPKPSTMVSSAANSNGRREPVVLDQTGELKESTIRTTR